MSRVYLLNLNDQVILEVHCLTRHLLNHHLGGIVFRLLSPGNSTFTGVRHPNPRYDWWMASKTRALKINGWKLKNHQKLKGKSSSNQQFLGDL